MGFLFLIAVVFVVVIVFNIYQTNQLKDSWADAATQLRLNYDRATPKIYGSRPGVSLRIKTIHRNKSKWTEFALRYDSPLPVNFGLEKQHTLSGITKLLSNGQDIEIGDQDFDDRAIITGRNPEEVRDFLSPDLRKMLKPLFVKFDQFEVNSLGLTCHMHKAVNTAAMVSYYTEMILDAAHTMKRKVEHTPQEPVRVPPPLPEKDEPTPVEEVEPAKVTEVVPEEAPPEPSPFEFAEPELIKRADPVEDVVEDPVVQEESAILEPETLKEIDDAFAATALELFETHTSNYAALRQFDQLLKNETISGRITVSSVSPFQHDRVFGRGPGLVVKGDLGKLENGQKVRLHIAYPEEVSISDLKSRTHSEIAYSGTLVKCDPFSRQFFLVAEEAKT